MKSSNKKHVLSYKEYKEFMLNKKIKKWLADILPNAYQSDLPVNPDETIDGLDYEQSTISNRVK